MNVSPQEEPADTGRDEGANLLGLAELAPVPRRIMRLLLREPEMSYADLCRDLAEAPADERAARDEVDAALAQLAEQNWVVVSGSDETRRYKANLRRRTGRGLAQVKPRRLAGGRPGKTIWEALDFGAPGACDAGTAGERGNAGNPPVPPPAPEE